MQNDLENCVYLQRNGAAVLRLGDGDGRGVGEEVGMHQEQEELEEVFFKKFEVLILQFFPHQLFPPELFPQPIPHRQHHHQPNSDHRMHHKNFFLCTIQLPIKNRQHYGHQPQTHHRILYQNNLPINVHGENRILKVPISVCGVIERCKISHTLLQELDMNELWVELLLKDGVLVVGMVGLLLFVFLCILDRKSVV